MTSDEEPSEVEITEPHHHVPAGGAPQWPKGLRAFVLDLILGRVMTAPFERYPCKGGQGGPRAFKKGSERRQGSDDNGTIRVGGRVGARKGRRTSGWCIRLRVRERRGSVS